MGRSRFDLVDDAEEDHQFLDAAIVGGDRAMDRSRLLEKDEGLDRTEIVHPDALRRFRPAGAVADP